MEVTTGTAHPDRICEGCLSRDRILSIITKDEIMKEYCAIIQEKVDEIGPLMLCWECIAHIQRYILFKNQCQTAHNMLISFMLIPKNLNSLSKLSIIKKGVDINLYHEVQNSLEKRVKLTRHSEDGVKNTPVYTEPETFHEIKGKNEDFCTTTNFEAESCGVNLTPEERKERGIAFIKVEEVDSLEDGFYEDDDFQNRNDFDDKEISAIKSDNIEKMEIKQKRSRNNKEDDFDDSDEEPLNKKRSTGRKNKKKKENGHTDDKRRHKREKPPGVVTNPRVSKKLQELNVEQGQLEMVVLSWEEVEQERQKAITSHVYTRHDYRCPNCIVGFNHKFKLTNHMKKHDPSSGDLICNVCEVRCKDAHSLNAHRRRHRVRWRCCACGETSSRAAVAADHVAREHGAPAPTHVCSVCGHNEPTLGKLRNHIRNHSEKQKCELCGKNFRDRTSLRTHLFIHKGEKEYSCPRCDKKFLFKKAMEVHMVTHDASAHLYCYQCDLTFKNTMSYTQHMKYSLKHIDPAKLKFACKLCDKKFVKATRLEEHNLAVHLKATPITCTIDGCNFACSSRPVLRTHIRMVHRNGRALRNHVCDICGKAYTTKKTLEGHMRSHTGERPFKCPQCPSTFGYEAALYNHNKLVHLKAKMSRRPQPNLQLPMPGPATDLT